MRPKPRIRLLIVTTAFIVGAVVIVEFCLFQNNAEAEKFNVNRTNYQFRFSQITQGTNHIIYSGNTSVARLKRALYGSPLRPLVLLAPRSVRAQWYSRDSATNTTVLWVGWTRKDYSYTVTNGIAFPAKPDFLCCFLSEPGGHTTQLSSFSGFEAPFIKEVVMAWNMPPNLTNWSGCTVHLKDSEMSSDVATIELQ